MSRFSNYPFSGLLSGFAYYSWYKIMCPKPPTSSNTSTTWNFSSQCLRALWSTQSSQCAQFLCVKNRNYNETNLMGLTISVGYKSLSFILFGLIYITLPTNHNSFMIVLHYFVFNALEQFTVHFRIPWQKYYCYGALSHHYD